MNFAHSLPRRKSFILCSSTVSILAITYKRFLINFIQIAKLPSLETQTVKLLKDIIYNYQHRNYQHLRPGLPHTLSCFGVNKKVLFFNWVLTAVCTSTKIQQKQSLV